MSNAGMKATVFVEVVRGTIVESVHYGVAAVVDPHGQIVARAGDPGLVSYYRSASNYALLLLGDPTHKPKLAGGGDNPAYNPRRALHILAVPVLDPTKQDAGAPDAATDIDAGTP